MPKLDTKKCYICNLTINMLGGYVQLGITRHAHVQCFKDAVYEEAVTAVRLLTATEKADEERRKKEHEEDRARLHRQTLQDTLNDLPRCPRCGRRLATGYYWEKNIEEMVRLAAETKVEVVAVSTGGLAQRGICAPCVEAERIASNAAKAQVKPPEPPKAEAKPEEKPEYYRPIDLE